MATLRMDTDVAHSTQSGITNTKSQLERLVKSMSGSVTGNLQQAWTGNSATEFYGVYDQWQSQMNNLLEQLGTLGSRLQNEITEWENMSSKLA